MQRHLPQLQLREHRQRVIRLLLISGNYLDPNGVEVVLTNVATNCAANWLNITNGRGINRNSSKYVAAYTSKQ